MTRWLPFVLLGALILTGCGGEGDDPVIITMDGMIVPTSMIQKEFDRTHNLQKELWIDADYERPTSGAVVAPSGVGSAGKNSD